MNFAMTKTVVKPVPAAEAIECVRKTYDQAPYPSKPFGQSTPEHLQAIAYMFGLDAPATSTARVLELGCSAGGNLIPIAVRHPKLQAFGVDLSGVQIEHGQQVLRDSGIGNVELRQASIEDIDESWGTFDYIICHGVYSWVPPQVRSAILRVCNQCLSDNGVAYISYNTYPGWKSREILRDAMMLRSSGGDAPEKQLAYARGMLDFLCEHTASNSVLKAVLDENMPRIRSAEPYYLVHEFLELNNSPCYFKDFLAAAAEHGLAYLAEANASSMFASNYPDNIAQPLLQECATQVEFEQYLDFVTNRAFRQTLLVKAGQASKVQYSLQRERLQNMHYAGWFEPQIQSKSRKSKTELHVKSSTGVSLQFNGPVSVALARHLHKSFPATRTMPDLAFAVVAQTGLPVTAVTEEVAATLKLLLVGGQVQARCQPVLLPKSSKSCPKRVPGAYVWKMQETIGSANKEVQTLACTPWHEPVILDSLEQQLWQHADGKRDLAELTKIVAEAAQKGRIGFLEQGKLVKDTEKLQELAEEKTPLAVASMRKLGLLV